MPAFVNSGARGWCGISPDEGTSVCPRSAKNPVKVRRSSLASIGGNQPTRRLPPCPRLQIGPELALALPHGLATLGDRGPDVGTEAAQRVGQVARDPLRRVALDSRAHEP